ncbi:MAG TPA: sensor histidine kinase [Hydrogenophaga sp.]|uniref:sensor histidine kinase n=1 Tax=Hydrogenophaga sp. TaxID=1904254 RepID=UPI002C67C772|nr:sensor histidine kinase [Hydrogenophaga sp.]HMN93319.1 sensor histidine kinase [Hydrogenophaga sp.]HMP10686.1 sensor histidine kinase [Hydrogenophaga sp.]
MNPDLPLTERLIRWIPTDARAGLLRRGMIVWAVAFFLGLYAYSQKGHSFGASLVYSYAISTCIWFCADALRIAAHRWLGTFGPHYWALSPRMVLFLFSGTVLGYVMGTGIGDLYSQQSTLPLILRSPTRFWGVLLSSLGISLAFLAFFYQREKGREMERQATEARLKLLETQLEPHMLFNTLANLRVLIQTDPPRAVAMLDRLGDYLRATLTASRTDAHAGGHTLADEFERLHDYLELMSVRMGPRLRYQLILPEALARRGVPPLLLQPLVENAIRHGLEPRLEGGEITVAATADDDRELKIEVNDTGVGMDIGPTPPRSANGGFGLSQVRERLESLPGKGRMEVESQPGQGTRIHLYLPAPNP